MTATTEPVVNRRTVLCHAMASAGCLGGFLPPALASAMLPVANVTGLYTVQVAKMATPRSTQDVIEQVRSWHGRVAVGGGRYSMGGQTATAAGLHLDMRQMNRLVWLDVAARTVRVQAGMRWRDVQEHLDPHDLAVKTMQSYANFTVGGSVSVNAHGRYVRHGPIANTVRALQLVLANGTVIDATPDQHADVFCAAIGGYGAVGVITEVELALARNIRIQRSVERVPLNAYVRYVQQQVLSDPTAVLHNADLLPPRFDEPVCVSWRQANESLPLTESARLVEHGLSYALEQNLIWALTELPGGQAARAAAQPRLLADTAVKWLNHEASLDVAQLEPRTRVMSTYALQEYFVPERQLVPFVRAMGRILRAHDVEALNVSIRHSPADTVSLLPWATEDVFSLVLFHKQRTWRSAQQAVGRWTRELIDLVLAHEGRYYLPYQLHATRAQFEKAYPEIEQLRQIKRQVDPDNKLTNTLWDRYL